MISPASPSALVMLRMLLLSNVITPPLLSMVTFPAAWSLLVSLSMVTLLRLRLPLLLMETLPDWPSVAPTSICWISIPGSSIVICLLVIIDKSLS